MIEPPQKISSFAKNTILMTWLTTISRITGYLRIIAFAAVLGAARTADAYNLANTIPNYIYELVMGGILSSLIIPFFIDYLVKKSEDEAWEVVSIVTNLSLVILGSLALLGILFPYYFVKIQTLLVPSKDIGLAVFFFEIFAIQVVFYGLSAITSAILNSYHKFGAPAFAPILNNVIVITTALFLYRPLAKTNFHLAALFLAWGTTFGVVLLFLAQLPSLYKIGVRYKFSFNFRHPAIVSIAKLSIPLILYVAGNVIPFIVENNLVFHRFVGGMTAITWTWPFFQLPFGIITVSIATALFPVLSKSFSSNKIDDFKNDIALGIRTIAFTIIPATVFLTVLSKPIILLFLGYGRFSVSNVNLFSTFLTYMSTGLFSFCLAYYVLRAFYAMQDTITPAIISLLTMVFNIGVDLILIRYLKVNGIAVGRSLTYSLNLLFFLYLLRRKAGGLNGKAIFKAVFKLLTAGAIMALAAYYALKISFILVPLHLLEQKASFTVFYLRLSVFLLPAIISLAVYVLISYLLKSDELNKTLRLVLKQKSR